MVLCGILCLLAISIGMGGIDVSNDQKHVFTNQIPSPDRNVKNKVFLEYAERLVMDERISPDYQVLYGNVKFRKEGMLMFCDSAHFYEKTNSFNAFGNVRMEQGDTLFVMPMCSTTMALRNLPDCETMCGLKTETQLFSPTASTTICAPISAITSMADALSMRRTNSHLSMGNIIPTPRMPNFSMK